MRILSRHSWLLLLIIAVLGVILVVLAVLQYSWSGQVSEAERQRMQANLNTAVSQFRREFNLELQRICLAFQVDPENFPGRDWPSAAGRFDNWLQASSDARLVANVLVWDTEAQSSSGLLQLNPATRKFEAIPWPARLEVVRAERHAAHPPRMPPEFRPSTWTLIQDVPLLLHPLRRFQHPAGPPAGGREVPGYLMIELNREVLKREFFPELAQRCFGNEQGFSYQIAIVSEAGPDKVLYQSDAALPPEFFFPRRQSRLARGAS